MRVLIITVFINDVIIKYIQVVERIDEGHKDDGQHNFVTSFFQQVVCSHHWPLQVTDGEISIKSNKKWSTNSINSINLVSNSYS